MTSFLELRHFISQRCQRISQRAGIISAQHIAAKIPFQRENFAGQRKEYWSRMFGLAMSGSGEFPGGLSLAIASKSCGFEVQ